MEYGGAQRSKARVIDVCPRSLVVCAGLSKAMESMNPRGEVVGNTGETPKARTIDQVRCQWASSTRAEGSRGRSIKTELQRELTVKTHENARELRNEAIRLLKTKGQNKGALGYLSLTLTIEVKAVAIPLGGITWGSRHRAAVVTRVRFMGASLEPVLNERRA